MGSPLLVRVKQAGHKDAFPADLVSDDVCAATEANLDLPEVRPGTWRPAVGKLGQRSKRSIYDVDGPDRSAPISNGEEVH
jgi:hypothetical protein